MDALTDVLRNVAISYPIFTGVAILAAVWYALVVVRERSGEAAVGSTSGGTEEGIRKARERQQAMLAQAATARAQTASSPPAASTPKSPAAAPAGETSERMKAAMARAPGVSRFPETAGTAGAPKPAHQNKGANDKNSLTQRLARLQEGKGDKNSNPLMGPEGGKGSSSSAKPCKKNGG